MSIRRIEPSDWFMRFMRYELREINKSYEDKLYCLLLSYAYNLRYVKVYAMLQCDSILLYSPISFTKTGTTISMDISPYFLEYLFP